MFGRARGRRRIGVVLGLGLYALVLVVSPLLHHDLDCHLRSPSHCSACTANPLASRVESGVRLDALRLPVAGCVETLRQKAPHAASPVCLPARSPPA